MRNFVKFIHFDNNSIYVWREYPVFNKDGAWVDTRMDVSTVPVLTVENDMFGGLEMKKAAEKIFRLTF